MDSAAATFDVFLSYARQDEALRDELATHLTGLKRQGLIRPWHHREIGAGQEWAGEIDTALAAADLVLLLVSANFIASDYCWDVEARRAFERHRLGEARVIPVVLRPVDLEGTPFAKLQTLPTDARPVTSWSDRDEAFRDVARGVRTALEELRAQRLEDSARTAPSSPSELRRRRFPPPELPERPYPVLLPYEHPALLGGRGRDLAELRARLRRRVPILGLSAPSGTGKSSLLLGGLVPALRAEERPVALERHPHEAGVAKRLLGDLVVDSGATVDDEDWQLFAARLAAVEDRTGTPPVLVIDQFEDVLRKADGDRARAVLGVLLAATVRRRPGRPAPPCRWLLAYRREYHGEVRAWLGNVLEEARARHPDGLEGLPHDLATPDRFHTQTLAPLGEALPGTDPADEATERFLEAIETPLTVLGEDGQPHFPWRFADGGALRLARAFADTRVRRPEAPLTPELQVVLAHLLARTGEGTVIEVPDDPTRLIDAALEDHLRRALDAAFPTGVRGTEARTRRARALLALRELATAVGQRDESRPARQLARAIGDDGEEILEQLATPLTRLVVPQDSLDGLRYVLSHDRMAEVVVRLVEDEGQHGELVVDAELLRLRRVVTLGAALHQSAAGQHEGPRLPRRQFQSIAKHAEALLWDDQRRAWWVACQKRRQKDRLRTTGWVAAAVVVLAAVATFAWWGKQREALFESLVTGEPSVAFEALDRLAREDDADWTALLARLRKRPGVSMDVLERGLDGVAEAERGEAVLRAVEIVLPWIAESPDDPQLIANLVWALDFAPGRDPELKERARSLRDRVLEPLRRQRPPPEMKVGDPDWIEIPAGTFLMGGTRYTNELPQHDVTISAFRLLRHEVTNAEYRRFVPDHDGPDDLPAANVSWYAAYTYAAWLGGRLPTEAEWEYAARAGCPEEYCDREGHEATVDAVAWTLRNSRDSGEPAAQRVTRLEANPWALYDMLGNLWEWTADWYDPNAYSKVPQMDPWGPVVPPPSGARRVARGGSFGGQADGARVANRDGSAPGDVSGGQGFRVWLPGRPEPLVVDHGSD